MVNQKPNVYGFVMMYFTINTKNYYIPLNSKKAHETIEWLDKNIKSDLIGEDWYTQGYRGLGVGTSKPMNRVTLDGLHSLQV